MALTAAVRYSNRAGNGLAGQNSYVVEGGQTIYHGALVGIDPNNGYLQNWSSASAGILRFRGLAMPLGATNVAGQTVANAVVGSPSSTPQPECPVNESGLILEGVTVAGALVPGTVGTKGVGTPVYATDENTFTTTATSNVGAIGEIVRCTTAGVADVRLFTPAEYLALEAVGKV